MFVTFASNTFSLTTFHLLGCTAFVILKTVKVRLKPYLHLVVVVL